MAKRSDIAKSQNLETFKLIWLDSLVNISQENIDTKKLLRKAINRLKTFEDSDACIEYIRTLSGERIVLIVSGRLGQITVPIIHQLPQLIAIYVYCSDKKRNEEWAKKYLKVKDVISDLKELIHRIQTDQEKRDEYKIDEPLPLSIFYTDRHHLAKDNHYFIYFQLLIDCLSRMKSTSHDKEHLIALCKEQYHENDDELNLVNDFERTYSPDRAIWWYTRKSFVCRMLDKAFQVLDIKLLYYFRFLIHDMQRQLKQYRDLSKIKTYRAQLMSNDELDSLRRSIGNFISINRFVPTIPNYQRAIEILEESDAPDDIKRVLFEIDADPRVNDSRPFCDIRLLNYFMGVEVVLFMAGTIFYHSAIRQENNIIIVQTEVCSDKNQEIQDILEDIKSECYFHEPNLLSLATILSKMKRFDDAEHYYQQVLDEMPNDHLAKARCYRGLANIAMEKDNYDLSIKLHRKALDVEQTVLRPGDPEIASEYSALAQAYIRNSLFYDAHDAYNQALRIWTQTLGKDHPKVATCLKNIAHAFELEQKNGEAIVYYQKTLAIYGKNLPEDHHDFGNIHNSMGHIYSSSGDIRQAFKHFDLAYKILKKSNTTTDLDMIALMKNMSDAHESMGNLHEALQESQNVLALQQKILPANDSEIVHTEFQIKRISSLLPKNKKK